MIFLEYVNAYFFSYQTLKMRTTFIMSRGLLEGTLPR